MTKQIDDAWLKAELRWAEWNGEEFQCIDASAAREMLAEIKRLRTANEPSLGERETAISQIPSARGDIAGSGPPNGPTGEPAGDHYIEGPFNSAAASALPFEPLAMMDALQDMTITGYVPSTKTFTVQKAESGVEPRVPLNSSLMFNHLGGSLSGIKQCDCNLSDCQICFPARTSGE